MHNHPTWRAYSNFSAYDLMLSDAMNDLQEQVKVEHVPAEKNEQGVAVSFWSLWIS